MLQWKFCVVSKFSSKEYHKTYVTYIQIVKKNVMLFFRLLMGQFCKVTSTFKKINNYLGTGFLRPSTTFDTNINIERQPTVWAYSQYEYLVIPIKYVSGKSLKLAMKILSWLHNFLSSVVLWFEA